MTSTTQTVPLTARIAAVGGASSPGMPARDEAGTPAAALSAALRPRRVAERAQTTGLVVLGGPAGLVSADGRLTRSRPSATTSTELAPYPSGVGASSGFEGFAGSGGFDEGARMVGLAGMVGIDLDKDACATAEAAGHRRFHGSIRDLDPTLLDQVELWVSGPPCPTFTAAGKRSGRTDMPIVMAGIDSMVGDLEEPEAWQDIAAQASDPRTALVLETLRFAVDLPNVRTIVAEQVPAVEPIWMEMASELAAFYQFTDVNVITVRADDLGAATRRERRFLIASRFEPLDFMGLPMRSWWHTGQTQEPIFREPVNPVVFPRTTMAQALGWPTGVRVNTRGARKTAGGNEFSADGPTPSMTGNGTRTWYRTDLGSVAGRITSAQAGLLQGFPADYPWQGSRTSQFQRVADTVSPIVAAAVIGVATGRPWQDAVWQRLEELYRVEVPRQLDLFAAAVAGTGA